MLALHPLGSLAILVCAMHGAPTTARASASPMLVAEAPLPGIAVTGAAIADSVAITVRCARTDILNDSSDCRVTLAFSIQALEPVELLLPDAAAASVSIDGEPASARREIQAGARAHLELHFERGLSVTTRDVEGLWIVSPVRARHVLFGESPGIRHDGDGARGVLLDGARLTVAGTIRVDASARDAVDVTVGAQVVDGVADVRAPRPSLALGVSGGGADDPTIQSGGPILGLALRGTTVPGDEGRVLLRFGYELALLEHVLCSVSVETDFTSLTESLLLEIASPEVLIILPSLAAGLGVVLRQEPNRSGAAGLRIHAGANVLSVGLGADLDYWPDRDDWTLTAGVRISV